MSKYLPKDMKAKPHAVITIQSWSQVHEIVDSTTMWAFRGQGDATWNLETKIYRAALESGYRLKDLRNREDWMLYQFRRRAHHYLAELPSKDARIDWLALMQHYGAPTRLLDFSHSLYVAAFFAIERAIEHAAIWGINLFSLVSRRPKVWKDRIDAVNRQQVALANEFVAGKRKARLDVLSVEPEQMNERLALQQGVFLFPCNISAAFNKNLASAFRFDPALFVKTKSHRWNEVTESLDSDLCTLKIVIPKPLFNRALDDLHSMNITSASLFPGLDGFSRSLYYHIR